MISELTQDLINKIKAVPAFQGRVGAAVGGTEADPTLANAPVPFAWVIYGGSAPTGEQYEGGKRYRETSYLFNVVIGIGYGKEADLLNTYLPVLEATQQAVAGFEVSGVSNAGLWEYQGERLDDVQPARLTYSITFSVTGYHTTT
jgi:hypothetical protein